MDSIPNFKEYVFFASIWLFFKAIESGYKIIHQGFQPYLCIKLAICLFLSGLITYFLIKLIKKSKNKDSIILRVKTISIMILLMIVCVVFATANNKDIDLLTIFAIVALTMLYFFKETRKKAAYSENLDLYWSYKNVNVSWAKNQTEKVEVGDRLIGPFFRFRKLWKLKTIKGKTVGYVYRPDIMDDLKRRKIKGTNDFIVSKIDSEGNIFVNVDIHILNSLFKADAKYDQSLEKTPFMLNTNEQPAKNITITRPKLESERLINSKCTLKSEQLFLDRCFENVKVVDADKYNANVFNNEILEFCYDEDLSILLLSNFNIEPVGHITDISVKNLIKSFDTYENLIRISVQKIENNSQTGKKNIYVRVLFYK